MAWYEQGLQGDAGAYATSPSPTQPAAYYGYSMYNCAAPVIIDSFSLNPNIAAGNTYRIPLSTFSMGTQLWIDVDVTSRQVSNICSWSPGVIYLMRHHCTLILRNKNSRLQLGSTDIDYITGFADAATAVPAYEFSIYGFNYVRTSGHPENNPSYAFPFRAGSAGLNSSIICDANANGISFWIAGFNSKAGPYGSDNVYVNFSCPVSLLGTISTATLNDPSWFDPLADSVVPEDPGTGWGEGGNIPDLPVSPTYPGTDMTFPDLPTGAGAFGFGRLTLFKPTAEQLGDALDILYEDEDTSSITELVEKILESFKKWFYKPEQYCVSLMISPVDAATSASKNIKFGKYDSEVNASYVSSQWHITDCGYIDVPLKYGSFLDFEPHAKLKIYLPFIGLRSVNANEIIGGRIEIKYYTDMLTGVSVCMMMVKRAGSNDTILYTYDCNVALQVPLTSENYNTVISSVMSAGVAAIGAGAAAAITGGASAPMMAGLAMSGINSAANAASNIGAPDLTQSGQLTSNSGVLCHPYPYLCVQMPIPTTPSNYNTEKGRPSNIYMNIGRCKGRTVISEFHADIPGAFAEDIEAIKAAFRRGVYV